MERPFAELDDLYREVVLDHYRSPRGREPVASPNVQHEGYNPICGDEVCVALQLDDGHLEDIQVRCRGCAISVASGSMMTEIVRGLSAEEVEEIGEIFRAMLHGEGVPEGRDLGDLEALQGVSRFPVRVKCALLPWMTLREAFRAWWQGHAAPEKATSTEEGATA